MQLLFSYLIYLSLLSCIIMLSHISAYKYYNKELTFDYDNYLKIKFSHLLALVSIAFIVGFRYKVGADWDGYRLYFEGRNFDNGQFEFGYQTINQLVFNLNGNYTFAFFIISFISWYFIFKGFPKQLLPLGIYFLFCDEWFFFSTNGVRQFVAFGIFLYAIKYLTNNNIKQFLLWIFVAGLFHRTAWLFLPLFLIPWDKLSNRNIWLSIYSASFIFSQNNTILNWLPKIFNSIASYFPIFNIYSLYFNTINYSPGEVTLNNYGIAFRVLITFFIIYYSKDILIKYPKAKIYYILYFIGSIITTIFIAIPIVSRFAIYFTFYRPFLLALTIFFIFQNKKNETSLLISLSVILLYFALFLYMVSNSPYNFTFFHDAFII